MRTNPFYDAWLFLTGSTDEHDASGVGWLLTVLYLALLIASIVIAYMNWRQDAWQRTKGHLATWFMRVMIGTLVPATPAKRSTCQRVTPSGVPLLFEFRCLTIATPCT